MKNTILSFILVCMFFLNVHALAADSAGHQEIGLREQGWTSFTAGTYIYKAQDFKGELTLISRRVNIYSLIVKIFSLDNTAACDFTADCNEDENGLVCVDANQPETKFLIKAIQDGVEVYGENITKLCKSGATFKGKYVSQ